MPLRILTDNTTLPMKILNFTLPIVSFWLTAFGLAIDWQYVALVAGSTFAGSLLLGFYRPEKTFAARIYKIAMSVVAGIVFGSVLVEWRQVTAPAYVGAAYCTVSMLALIFLRSIVGLSESNANGLTKTILQRVFFAKIENGEDQHRTKGGTRRRPPRRHDGIHIQQTPGNAAPTVTIDANAKPDEIRVIEQTEVKTTKETDK